MPYQLEVLFNEAPGEPASHDQARMLDGAWLWNGDIHVFRAIEDNRVQVGVLTWNGDGSTFTLDLEEAQVTIEEVDDGHETYLATPSGSSTVPGRLSVGLVEVAGDELRLHAECSESFAESIESGDIDGKILTGQPTLVGDRIVSVEADHQALGAYLDEPGLQTLYAGPVVLTRVQGFDPW